MGMGISFTLLSTHCGPYRHSIDLTNICISKETIDETLRKLLSNRFLTPLMRLIHNFVVNIYSCVYLLL